MKTLLTAIGLFLVSLSLFAASEIEAFGNRMMTFYQSPSLPAFESLQQDADRLDEDLRKNGSEIILAAAIARISEKHLWPITAKGLAGERAREILAGTSDLARYVDDDQRVDPAKLDIWWASFFSTGDTVYLEKILVYAGEPLPEGDVEKMLLIRAASWSFQSNCRQDKVVRAFARQQLSLPKNSHKKTFLEECLEPKRR